MTPDFIERFQQYVQKAVREEKLHSSWLNPNADYESGIAAFVDGILDPARLKGVSGFACIAFARRTALHRRAQQPQPADPEGHGSRSSRFLSGNRTLGSVAGRSGQPSTRRFCGARAKFLAKSRQKRVRIRGELGGWNRQAGLDATACLSCGSDIPEVFALGDYEPLARRGPACGPRDCVYARLQGTGMFRRCVALFRAVHARGRELA